MATGGITRWDWWRAAPGFGLYLPEPYWFRADGGLDADEAAEITALCLARWSDWYRATPSFRRVPMWEGPLPETQDAREAFVHDLFERFAQHDATERRPEMSLRLGERWVLDAHDGFPGPVQLTPEQFTTLQDRLEQAGLPRDLYYQVLQQREVVESTQSPFGAVVRGLMLYSPRQWETRDAQAIEALEVPTEEERQQRFADALTNFRRQVLLRLQELREPGSPDRFDETEAFGELIKSLASAESLTRNFPMPDREYPLPRSASTPTALTALRDCRPVLRRLHPDANLWQLRSDRARPNHPIQRWSVQLWSPSTEKTISYTLVNGVLFGPAKESNIDARLAEPIWRLSDDEPTAVLDSDAALERAELAGGAEFRSRTDGTLGELRLHGWNAQRILTWVASYGRRDPRPFAALTLWLNALTGELIGKQEPPDPPASS
jgi:hypothetical protein